MKICAITSVRNSNEIATATIKNFILNGITDFFIIDHCSDESLRDFLDSHIKYNNVNIYLLKKDTLPFYQSYMMNLLADIARHKGYDIAIPFDADEFWCNSNTENTLADEIISTFKVNKDAKAIKVPADNFLQFHKVINFNLESLKTVNYKIVNQKKLDRKTYKDSNLSLIPLENKIIFKLDKNILLKEGNHSIKTKDNSKGHVVNSNHIRINHIPLFCKNQIFSHRQEGINRKSAGYTNKIGFHKQELAEKNDVQLNDYWESNTWSNKDTGIVFSKNFPDLEKSNIFEIIYDKISSYDRYKDARFSCLKEIDSATLNKVIFDLIDNLGKKDLSLQKALRILSHKSLMIKRILGIKV